MKQFFFIIVFNLFICYLASAQDSTIHFTQKQLQDFEIQAKASVRNFCYYLGDLASSGTKAEDKPSIKQRLKNLFIDYAKVEVLSVSHPNKPRSYSINKYVDLVGNYAERFRFVVMQFYKVRVDVQHLKQIVKDGKIVYMGTFSYWQRFLASNAEKEFNYTEQDLKGQSDETPKTGVFYLIQSETKSNDKGKRWIILLGDIKAKELKPL